MDNIACRIFKEQIDLLTSLPNQEEAKTILYQAIINSLNQFEKQNENQIENQFENAYISESVSVLGISILNLLSKNIIWKEFSNNYGGKRENSGRKSNAGQVIDKDNICLPYGKLEDNSLKDKDIDKDNNKEIDTDKKKNNIFKKPTIDEVRLYCQERNNGVDAEKWINHYTSNGWKVGKNPMKDWKAAVRTWEKSEKKEKKQQGQVFIDEHICIDETMPEFSDMKYEECCRAYDWLQEKMYCQTITKDKFVEIVRKFKNNS